MNSFKDLVSLCVNFALIVLRSGSIGHHSYYDPTLMNYGTGPRSYKDTVGESLHASNLKSHSFVFIYLFIYFSRDAY